MHETPTQLVLTRRRVDGGLLWEAWRLLGSGFERLSSGFEVAQVLSDARLAQRGTRTA